jgi:hypothetical protein
MLNSFLDGAICMASWAIAFFFFRFKKTTGDPLFAYFAAAFVLFGVERICLELISGPLASYVYFIRLLAFLLILFGILVKNRKEKKSQSTAK